MVSKAKAKKPKKKKPEPIDGLSPKDIEKIRKALRQVWVWSYPRRLCISRAIGKDGFPRCEKCKKKVPKIHPDHIEACGKVDSGFLRRLFCPSAALQALCGKCHGKKTRAERKALKLEEEALNGDFF